MADDMKSETRVQVPYVSFTTLKGLIDRMHKEGGVPNRIDRSYLTGMSGGYQVQVLMSLKVLGLIDEEEAPTDQLSEVTSNPEKFFVPYMNSKVREMYSEMVELGQKNGTAAQLADAFRTKFGLSGSTLAGAIRFYLEASKFAGVPVGKLFKTPPRAKKGSAKKQSNKSNPVVPTKQSISSEGHTVVGNTNTLRASLPSGGFVELSTQVDVTQLTADERTFVFDLIDKVKAYESNFSKEPSVPAEDEFSEFDDEDEGES